MPSLSRRGSFLTAALVAAVALWASAAPTIIYPLYAQQWTLSTATTTALFAVYPLALVPTLVVFGNLSDSIGRRAVILLGLGLLVAGSVAFAVAPDLTWVFVGRALMGIGVGFALSPATAAIVEFGRDGSRAGPVTTAATAGGLALATIVGGALVEYAPQPLHLSFWVLTAMTLLAFSLALMLPRHTPDESAEPWRPRLPMIPRDSRTSFAAGTLGISAAYSMGAIFLALGAQIARDLVGSSNAFVDGLIISLSAVVIGVVAIAARAVPARTALTLGPVFATVGLAALLGAGLAESLVLFLVSSVLGGVGYSFMFAGGLGLVASSAPTHHRGMVLSAAYVVGYVLQAATALGLGALVGPIGLQATLEIGVPVVLAIGFLSLVLARRNPPPPPPGTAASAAVPLERIAP